MPKKLEYINEIQNELDKYPRDKWKAYWNGRCNVIRQSLTFYTAEEIVKELIKLDMYIGIEHKQVYKLIYTSSICYPMPVDLFSLPDKLAHSILDMFMEVLDNA